MAILDLERDLDSEDFSNLDTNVVCVSVITFILFYLF
jgi:hypothetical protein